VSRKIKAEPRAPSGKPARKRNPDLSGLGDPTGLPTSPAPAALPDGWQVVRLGDLADVKYGKANPNSSGNIPVIGSGGVFAWTDKPLVDYPTIVIGRKGTAGEIHFADKPSYPSDTTFYLAWQKQVNVQFLFYFLTLHKPSGEHAKTTLPSLQRHVLEDLVVTLPPESEQRAIARVLATIQRAVEAQDQLIAATRAFKRALMRHLFTYGAVPPADAARVPLKDTEIGAVPVGWEVVRLGEVCEKPQYGYTESATEKPIGPKFLRITDIQNGGVNWSIVPHCPISESLFEKYALKDGDIVVARIGATTGKSYFISNPPPSVFASYLIRVRTKATLLPKYLSYFAETEDYWKQINESKGGRLKQGINIPILTSLRLQLPPLPEQRAIARILTAVDAKIAAEEKRKAALQTLFKTMLHQLMTGQIRVNAAA
jgi:type I restriction enzyme S subunit